VLFDLEESSQVGLKRLFSRRLSIRSEPRFEVLDPDPVLDLGFADGDRNHQVLMDPVDPVVLAKKVQSTTHSFIETARGDFDCMFRTACVATRYLATSERHPHILTLRFYFAIVDTALL
jgi:hypothetical protein